MNRAIKERVTEITSLRDIGKEFTYISKLFNGKESELNWEERDRVIKQLRSVFNSDLIIEYKENIVTGIRTEISGLVKSIHSLRTSVALEALSLVSDISLIIGDALDQYTMEIILANLLKCSVITKKLIASKLAEVTHTFLSNTNFHLKMLHMLCKTRNEKNVQLRQSASNHIKTIMETHASKDHVRSIISNSDGLSSIDLFLKKGLADASLGVRDSCRIMYRTYKQLWPEDAEILCRSLDPTTQKQLLRPIPIIKSTISRSNSMSVLSPIVRKPTLQKATSFYSITPTSYKPIARSPVPSKPIVPSPTSSKTIVPSPSSSKAITTTFRKPAVPKPAIKKNIPPTSAEVQRNLNIKASRLSHMSSASAPSSSIAHALKSRPLSPRRTQSEFHQQSVVASASLLHMLKSSDTQMRCKGIHLLSDRLKNTDYTPTSLTTILPPDVPSKIDLLPILMDFLTRQDLDIEIYQTLMSWESLAGIFVYVLSVNYYCPTLIIAAQHKSTKKFEITSIFSKGLLRVKMFLKRNDPLLAKRLLDILQSINGDQKLLDASVKQDLQLFPSYKQDLQCGLLNWMNEILCDYVGLAEDEDAEILMEGSQWLNVTGDGSCAEEWFDTTQNVQSYVSFVVDALLTTKPHDVTYPLLCGMARNLKIANQRVFENETTGLESQKAAHVEKALMSPSIEQEDAFSITFDYSNDLPIVGSVDLNKENTSERKTSLSPEKKKLARSAPQDNLHVNKKLKQIYL